jgi:hypothetical protein
MYQKLIVALNTTTKTSLLMLKSSPPVSGSVPRYVPQPQGSGSETYLELSEPMIR